MPKISIRALISIVLNLSKTRFRLLTLSYGIESQNFDEGWYLLRNPDVAEARLPPLRHYFLHGRTEGRSPHPLFAPIWYGARYPDVAASGLNLWDHFLRYGAGEGRSPHPFLDLNWYKLQHRADADAQSAPFKHYLSNARIKGYDPNPFFASKWYADRYLKDNSNINPLIHYLKIGAARGLAPHPIWNEARYLELNPEIKAFRGGYPGCGYEHFVERGVDEIEAGYYRHFSFTWNNKVLDYDRVSYLADNPDAEQAIRRGEFSSGLAHLFSRGVWEAFDGLRAIYGSRHGVRLLTFQQGDANTNKRHLCIFAHYDRDTLIDKYVVTYVCALEKNNINVVFVTATSSVDQLDKIRPYVSCILIKNEAGRDFGSWWLALKTLGVNCGHHYSRVILANDSIYFPVRPIKPFLNHMEQQGFNLYGLSDSRELGAYHVQSFFLAFDAKAQAALFPEFIQRFEQNYLLTKWGQIREYELGITKIAKQCGLSVGAFLGVDDLREDILADDQLNEWADKVRGGLEQINISHDLWSVAIARYCWPALKLELLRDNPKRASGLDSLPSLIRDGEVDIKDVYSHLSRSNSPKQLIPRAEPSGGVGELICYKVLKGFGREVADRLVLFAHYDPQGMIDPHVVKQVEALHLAGCAVAFITSTSLDSEIVKIAPHACDILIKNDYGRDFGSWYLALKNISSRIATFRSLIWMNDSTYFPLFDPSTMFRQMDQRNLDFWGVVDSDNIEWHIMSWFWSFGPEAIKQGWLDWYMQEYNVHHTKWSQIHNYEIRLPGLIRRSGLATDAYIRSSDVADLIIDKHHAHPYIESARRGGFNMMHNFWRDVIVDLKCPAIKVELVRHNPLGIDLSKLLETVRSETDYDSELIRNHIKRIKASHLPPPEQI